MCIRDRTYTERDSESAALKVRLKVTGESYSNTDINLIADREVWGRIIVGELTLEAILIGGSGAIKKPVPDFSDNFYFVMKHGYIIQNRILVSGLSFFKEQYHEA